MPGFEELKVAYKAMRDECNFWFEDATLIHNKHGDEIWRLVFKCFNVGITMSMQYEYFTENFPISDDIIFYGDPYTHFSIYCYRIITDFIETLQKNRSDKNTMKTFIDYLKKEKE